MTADATSPTTLNRKGPPTLMLLREALGLTLRGHRHRQSLTLRDVAAASAVALGYLSEVERGTKEVSSELLEAITGALGVPLSRVLLEVADRLPTQLPHAPGPGAASVTDGTPPAVRATRSAA